MEHNNTLSIDGEDKLYRANPTLSIKENNVHRFYDFS